MTAEKIKELVSKMTLEEKAAMCSGAARFLKALAMQRTGTANTGTPQPSTPSSTCFVSLMISMVR